MKFNLTRRILIFMAVFAAFAGNAFSQISTQETNGRSGVNTITTAVPFLTIAPDSRSGAMGDGGAGISPDVNSIHWNPAKLAFAPNIFGFGVSYSPWLKALVPDINLGYLTFYNKFAEDQAIGASLRFFSLGNIVFTDQQGLQTGEFNPYEAAVDVAYARKLSQEFSIGAALRFIYSNLASGQMANGQEIKPGTAVAADISAYYRKETYISNNEAVFSFGGNISNIGSKMNYSDNAERSFLPTNLRIGPALSVKADKFNVFSFHLDINKLLVPTNPKYQVDSAGQPVQDGSGKYIILKGEDPNRSVASGIFGSFSDAPNGASEEFSELYYSTGVEYIYYEQFALRGGFFYEHPNKGNRQFFTLGAGFKFNIFNIDFAYLIPTVQRNPLENTLRFSLLFNFDKLR